MEQAEAWLLLKQHTTGKQYNNTNWKQSRNLVFGSSTNENPQTALGQRNIGNYRILYFVIETNKQNPFFDNRIGVNEKDKNWRLPLSY